MVQSVSHVFHMIVTCITSNGSFADVCSAFHLRHISPLPDGQHFFTRHFLSGTCSLTAGLLFGNQTVFPCRHTSSCLAGVCPQRGCAMLQLVGRRKCASLWPTLDNDIKPAQHTRADVSDAFKNACSSMNEGDTQGSKSHTTFLFLQAEAEGQFQPRMMIRKA